MIRIRTILITGLQRTDGPAAVQAAIARPPRPHCYAPVMPPPAVLSAAHLAWLDLEMTGLDPDRHVILEIAGVVTAPDLTVLANGPVLAVHRTAAELARADDWSLRTHQASGLLDRVHASSDSCAEVERQVLAFFQAWIPPGASPLCGNSIHHDRLFLRREMPALHAFFHYRNIDVSTLKELVQRWYPPAFHAPAKRSEHRAQADIQESIAELRWYRDQVWVRPPGSGSA